MTFQPPFLYIKDFLTNFTPFIFIYLKFLVNNYSCYNLPGISWHNFRFIVIQIKPNDI